MLPSMSRLTRLAAVVAFIAALAAPSASAATRSEEVRGRVHRVRMADRYRNVFRPRIIDISRGDTVVWTNVGNVTHTATTAAWDSAATAASFAESDLDVHLLRRATWGPDRAALEKRCGIGGVNDVLPGAPAERLGALIPRV